MPRILPRLDGRNFLISTLPSQDQKLIKTYLTEVSLVQGMVIEIPDEPVETIIFPLSGVVSIVVSPGHRNRSIEAGIFGFEGMSGISALLNSAIPSWELNIQIPGNGLQISVTDMRMLLEESHTLRDHLLPFVQVMLTQTAQTAFINKHGSLEQRLSRWLLMCHDRVPTDRITITHEFIAIMLSVRRPGVTVATQILEGKGLIRAKRGEIHIIDRQGLEQEASGYYGIPEKEYARLFPPR